MGNGTVIADYASDVINHVNTSAYLNGLTNRTDYDPLGRAMPVRVNDGAGDIVDYRYGYDDVGNRVYMQRAHQPNQPYEVYQYDGLYQLVDAWYGADAADPAAITSYDLLQTYELDLQGNRLSVTEDGETNETDDYGPDDGTQSTNVMNQYETVDSLSLGYDLRGNTLTDGIGVYGYDVLNRQISVTNASGTTEYVYDVRGRRVAKVMDGITITHYIYDTQYRVIEERDGSEALLATYTYGTGMDEPLTMERDGETYYYHRDALGSITEVSDSDGEIVESTLTITPTDRFFTGQRWDGTIGLYDYNARFYDPQLGQFTQPDSLVMGATNPIAWNRYAYVHNNQAISQKLPSTIPTVPATLSTPCGMPGTWRTISRAALAATMHCRATCCPLMPYSWLHRVCLVSRIMWRGTPMMWGMLLARGTNLVDGISTIGYLRLMTIYRNSAVALTAITMLHAFIQYGIGVEVGFGCQKIKSFLAIFTGWWTSIPDRL